ncbi:site-specific recombinase [Rhodovulum sulfidophilum]|uniref:Site-specific recombinase n=1 Tax=Rhodovulum sulfidophilum TaxID=35806 RepID=A0A0D6B1W2_RHOSU|nr:site-specific recombinase [Rhodovulum sulfidophilum]
MTASADCVMSDATGVRNRLQLETRSRDPGGRGAAWLRRDLSRYIFSGRAFARGDAVRRGANMKRKLETPPLHAETVRLTFPLASEGYGTSGQVSVKGVVNHQNKHRMFTRKGGRRRVDQLHRTMIRRTYMQSASLLQSLQQGGR